MAYVAFDAISKKKTITIFNNIMNIQYHAWYPFQKRSVAYPSGRAEGAEASPEISGKLNFFYSKSVEFTGKSAETKVFRYTVDFTVMYTWEKFVSW